MPCWEVRTVSLDIETLNDEYITQAAEALGYTVYNNGKTKYLSKEGQSFSISDGSISSTSMTKSKLEQAEKDIRKQITVEIIKRAAARNKWAFKQTNPNKVTLRRS